MQIGNVTINGKLALAPMAGVTDLAFRHICREQLFSSCVNIITISSHDITDITGKRRSAPAIQQPALPLPFLAGITTGM